MASQVDRVLDSAKRCCERWGFQRVTVDDIAVDAGISRATLYRLFPGGKDVLFEALRVRELEEFFTILRDRVEGATSIEDLLVRAGVAAPHELRADDPRAVLLATEPGATLGQLTVEGVPRILRFATAFIAPLAEPFLDRQQARSIIDVLARLVISYFLAPSDAVDLGDEASAREFLLPLIHSALHETTRTSTR